MDKDMCGRYTISHSTEEILERFNVLKEIIDLQPNYNVAPSQMVPVVMARKEDEQEPVRVLQVVRWGLMPFWAKDPKMRPFINARVETIVSKPSFKSSFSKKRCIIPADGFYEWKPLAGKKKQPMRIRLPGDQLFGFAGLYDDWTSPDGEVIRTCAIITVPPNDAMKDIHNRMPAILTREDEQLWLNPDIRDTKVLAEVLHPYADEIDAYPVSTMVNSASVNRKDCIEALAN
jgi:putative SOS response-associated peptidase YedK